MSLLLSLCVAVLVAFVAGLFFGGWPVVIAVGGLCLFVVLIPALTRGFLRSPTSANPAADACLDDARTSYLDQLSISRLDLDIRVQLSPQKTLVHANTTRKGAFERPPEECDDEGILDVGDMAVPEIVRDHERGFSNPAQYIMNLGNDEYLLFGDNSELLDAVYLKD